MKLGVSAISLLARSWARRSLQDLRRSRLDASSVWLRLRELLAARAGGRLIGSEHHRYSLGQFRFLRSADGSAGVLGSRHRKSLLEETVRVFERWGVRHSGLFTFPTAPNISGCIRNSAIGRST